MLEEFVEERVRAAVRDGHVGIVAGVLLGSHSFVAGAGRADVGDPASRPSGRTIFRIASLTKPFTGAALATAVARGDLALEDSATCRLPSWFGLPEAIRLSHLAAHRSGLPRGVDGLPPEASVREFADAVSRIALLAEPGTAFTYSNIGASIVGMVLTGAGARSYDSILVDYVTGELDLHDITTTPDQDRVAPGHDDAGRPTFTPTSATGVAAGGLYGTVADLLVFLGAHWSSPPPAFLPAIRPRADAGDGHQIGQFWLIGSTPEGSGVRAAWHNGALPGYRSFMAVDPTHRVAVAVLSNTQRPVDSLGSELLDAALSS
jgi:serine-type D-Ala-D-Ala carboxypeptidase/endopeptidase